MKGSFTNSINTSQTSTPNKKTTVMTSLNLAKVSNYMQTTEQEGLSTTASTKSNLSQIKFQFDIIIQKVELQAPSAVFVFVQIQKGTSTVNTKKKLRIDQTTRIAQFNEKLSVVTALDKDSEQNGVYNSKQIQFKLYAYYNSKEKAIGICSLDLSTFVNNKDLRGVSQKALFQKCFDKNANIQYEVKVKEKLNPITESIIEEVQEQSSNIMEETQDLIDTSRISTLESARVNTLEQDFLDDHITLEQKSRSITEPDISKSPIPLKKADSKISDSKLQSYMKQSTQKIEGSQSNTKVLQSARTMQISMSTSQIMKQSPAHNEQIITSNRESKTPLSLVSLLQKEDSLSKTPQRETQNTSFSDQYVKQLEDKCKQQESEIQYLKKEIQDQKQKIVTFEIREERTREYELKCKEVEQYRQKCEMLEQHIRETEQEKKDQEAEKLLIIESYERKITDLKQINAEVQQQLNTMKTLQNYNTTTYSTQPDDDIKQQSPSKEEENTEDSYKQLYEQLLTKMKKKDDETQQLRKNNEQLETQVMICKGQIAQLVNELYSMEKEQMMDN